jgi:ppGpp synthetase/RelA/SpoT-type nucleotidyltranferase
MAEWAVPLFSRPQVNRAGRILLDVQMEKQIVVEHALQMVNNWRATHNYPLNTFQVSLRKKAKAVDAEALVAQRIKRLTSIMYKLQRFPEMKLTQMQDIGGCRAIVKSVRLVDGLVLSYERSDLKHALATKDDYIQTPQASGYRGVHLVYRYFSDKNKTIYNDLKIEIQFRSQLQHAWATAVETVGTFIGQALKASRGREDWLRFFALMSSAIAMREKRPPVPGTPNDKGELTEELRQHALKLNVVEVLQAFGYAMRTLTQPSAEMQSAHFYLISLDSKKKTVTVEGFKQNETERASER